MAFTAAIMTHIKLYDTMILRFYAHYSFFADLPSAYSSNSSYLNLPALGDISSPTVLMCQEYHTDQRWLRKFFHQTSVSYALLIYVYLQDLIQRLTRKIYRIKRHA